MVVRNAAGQLVGGLDQRIWSENVESLEVQAVLEEVKLAIDRGSQNIEVETDSLNVVEQIQGRTICGGWMSYAKTSRLWHDTFEVSDGKQSRVQQTRAHIG